MNDEVATTTEPQEGALTAEIADDVKAVKNLIEAKLGTVEQIKKERTTAREMLNDTLRADNEYAGIEANIKDAEKRLKEIRTRLSGSPEIANLEANIKEMNRKYNEARNDAGDYLVMYADKTGQLSFIHSNGNEIKIERSAKAKIVVKKKRKQPVA